MFLEDLPESWVLFYLVLHDDSCLQNPSVRGWMPSTLTWGETGWGGLLPLWHRVAEFWAGITKNLALTSSHALISIGMCTDGMCWTRRRMSWGLWTAYGFPPLLELSLSPSLSSHEQRLPVLLVALKWAGISVMTSRVGLSKKKQYLMLYQSYITLQICWRYSRAWYASVGLSFPVLKHFVQLLNSLLH